MRKRILPILLLTSITFFASNTFSQALQFDVINKTPYLLHGLFISPYNAESESATTDWSEDLLEVTFDPDVTAIVTIPEDYYPDYCKFKFKVSYIVDGTTYEEVLCWINACENASVKIIPKEGDPNHYMECQY